jgi:NAD-dependent dihydropyrimidine dehydrogenase PreA subunit
MQEHVKVYFKYFGYVCQEQVMCEVCGCPAKDLHHIKGRGKGKNIIENLCALCRDCHNKCHAEIIKKDQMQEIHNKLLEI